MRFIQIISCFLFLFSFVSCDKNKAHVAKKYGENGKLEMEVEMLDDKPNGLGKQYFLNGKIHEEAHFKNGKLHGKSIIYYENGKIEIIQNYKNGEFDGKRFVFSKSGKKIGDQLYSNGRAISGGTFYENGKPLSVFSPSKVISYYENGEILFYDCIDSDNKPIGSIKFNTDGKITEFKGKLSCVSKNDSMLLDARNPEWRSMK